MCKNELDNLKDDVQVNVVNYANDPCVQPNRTSKFLFFSFPAVTPILVKRAHRHQL